MRIPVNKNIDNYKDDFFKGLTLKQTLYAALTLATGVGVFAILNMALHLEATVSIYLSVPFCVPVAALGFLKPHGMSLSEYRKKKKQMKAMPVLYFEPDYLRLEVQDYYLNAGQEDGPEKTRPEGTIYLETQDTIGGVR